VRILGVDLGTQRLGWGIVETERQAGTAPGSCCHVESGTLVAPAGELLARLLFMTLEVQRLCARLQPAQAAVEAVFAAKNARSTLALGQVSGAVLVEVLRAGIEVHSYSVATIKQAVTGYGGASKEQVQQMVWRLLGRGLGRPVLPGDAAAADDPSYDTSDALAVALCHAQVAASPLRAALRSAR
jgi:crossover junction endodeoxyribonuclease RuvC